MDMERLTLWPPFFTVVIAIAGIIVQSKILKKFENGDFETGNNNRGSFGTKVVSIASLLSSSEIIQKANARCFRHYEIYLSEWRKTRMTIFYKRTIDNLKTICINNISEIKNILSIGDALRSFLDGFMSEGIVPPEEIIPLMTRADNIWSSFKDVELMLEDVINIDDLSDMNDDNIRRTIKKEQNLLASLLEIGELPIQAEHLIIDAKCICDYWCRQKWLNGKCGFDFCLENIHDFSLSGFSEVIQTLKENIQQLSDYKNALSIV